MAFGTWVRVGMFKIPVKYSIRNILVRRTTAVLTTLGISLVVGTFIAVMALSEGISHVFTASGGESNFIILRQNASAESMSGVDRDDIAVVSSLPGIDKDRDGKLLLSAELVSGLYLERYTGGGGNVTFRGVQEKAFALRPALKLVEGRLFRPGVNEVVVSKGISERFKNCKVGDTIRFGTFRWKVVGIFDAGGTAPDSEIWTDVEGAQSDLKRPGFSSVLIQITGKKKFARFAAAMSGDSRLQLEAKSERQYYAKQTESAGPIRYLWTIVSAFMLIAACFGAMNTMFATIAARTREVATLRALGFSRASILFTFVMESILISTVAGLLGILGGIAIVHTALAGVTGTANMITFSEVVFAFRVTPATVAWALVFSIVIGAVGGLLPAWRAAFTKITVALRQVA